MGKSYPPRRESWEAKNVFETYVLLGPSRSIKLLHERTGRSFPTLCSWSTQFGWAERLAKKDKKALEIIESDDEKILLETIRRRHQEAYQEVQEKSLQAIKKVGSRFDNGRDAAVALDIGIKGERNVLGLNDSKLKAGIIKEGFAGFLEAVFKNNE